MNPNTIEIERYEPNLGNPGYLRYVGNITVKELYDEIENRLKTISTTYNDEPYMLSDLFEYFSISPGIKYNEAFKLPIPKDSNIAVYVVRGSNEGHFIHIDAISSNTHTSLILAKTFCGLEKAILIANEITKMLYD